MTGRDRADAVLALGVSGGGPLAALRAVSPDAARGERGRAGDAAREMGRAGARGPVLVRDGARSAPPMPSIADNAALAADLSERYGLRPKIIAYGADHAQARPSDISDLGLPRSYALAIARAEPENNLEVLIRAFGRMPDRPLVIVANWSATAMAAFCARPGRARGTSTWSRPNTIPAACARSGTGRGSTSMAIPPAAPTLRWWR
jgi:hypothetical protein